MQCEVKCHYSVKLSVNVELREGLVWCAVINIQCVVNYNVADVSEVQGPLEVFGHGVK